jgi:hypothetical protein
MLQCPCLITSMNKSLLHFFFLNLVFSLHKPSDLPKTKVNKFLFLPNFDYYPQPCLAASESVQLSQNNAAMYTSNHLSQQNPISAHFLPNLDSYPQPCLSASQTVKSSQNNAVMSASDHFSRQNLVSAQLVPNLNSSPQLCLSVSKSIKSSKNNAFMSAFNHFYQQNPNFSSFTS